MTLLILSTLGREEGAALGAVLINSILSLYFERLSSDETEMVFLGSRSRFWEIDAVFLCLEAAWTGAGGFFEAIL